MFMYQYPYHVIKSLEVKWSDSSFYSLIKQVMKYLSIIWILSNSQHHINPLGDDSTDWCLTACLCASRGWCPAYHSDAGNKSPHKHMRRDVQKSLFSLILSYAIFRSIGHAATEGDKWVVRKRLSRARPAVMADAADPLPRVHHYSFGCVVPTFI